MWSSPSRQNGGYLIVIRMWHYFTTNILMRTSTKLIFIYSIFLVAVSAGCRVFECVSFYKTRFRTKKPFSKNSVDILIRKCHSQKGCNCQMCDGYIACCTYTYYSELQCVIAITVFIPSIICQCLYLNSCIFPFYDN